MTTPTNPLSQALEALEAAQNGLRWYETEHPEDESDADEEMHAEIDSVMANIRTLLSRGVLVITVEQLEAMRQSPERAAGRWCKKAEGRNALIDALKEMAVRR